MMINLPSLARRLAQPSTFASLHALSVQPAQRCRFEDFDETSIPVTLNTQFHVDTQFSNRRLGSFA